MLSNFNKANSLNVWYIRDLKYGSDIKLLRIYRYLILCLYEGHMQITAKGLFFFEQNAASFKLVLYFLKLHSLLRIYHFIDMVGVDYLSYMVKDLILNNNRYAIVYILNSILFNLRILVHVYLQNRLYPIWYSIYLLYQGAIWAEREIFDLFGIFFSDHPDLRRLLTEYGMKGHPLRKTYPLTGFFEVRFENVQKKIIRERLTLMQESRQF